jgi:non-specific serine/threonine protein kinase
LIARFRILLKDRGRAGRAAIPRHETLSASIDWSVELLSEKERLLLSRLAVFAGSWTLDAAEAVCSDARIPEWEVADLLSALVSRSLVAFQPDKDRYRLLETIRQYLLDRLEDDGSTILALRHATFFAALAEEAEPHLTGPRQSEWMDRLEVEHENLRAAMGRASRPGGDIDYGLRIAGSAWRFWDMRGHAREGREWMRSLLDAAPDRQTMARGRALFGAAELAFRYGDMAAAKRWNEEFFAIQEQLGDRGGIAKALATAGNIASIEGDLESARSHYEHGLALCRELGDRRGTAVALNNLGNLAQDLGHHDDARALQQESLEIRKELGDQRGIAIALNNLANVARTQGDHATATRLRTECLEIHRKLGNRRGIAITLTNLGVGALAVGNYERAETLMREGLELLWELGDRTSVASNLEAMGYVLTATGRSDEAAQLWGAVERFRARIGATIEPSEQEYKQSSIETAIAQLGLTQYEAAHSAGCQMEISQAVNLVLG